MLVSSRRELQEAHQGLHTDTCQRNNDGVQATARVEIDQRFSAVFSDAKFKRKTVVDKRGRKTQQKCVGGEAAAVPCSAPTADTAASVGTGMTR
jgi:hypothetical protein